MNKVCKYIESIDFQIKKRIRSTSDFDYKALLSQPFTLNKKLYLEIADTIATEFKSWKEYTLSQKQSKVEKSLTGNLTAAKIDREAQCATLKAKLLTLVDSEVTLANYLVHLFYVDKPSYSKATLWQLVGNQLYENIASKTSSFYFPVKDPTGTLKFLYENYSIQKLELPKEEQLTDD